MDHDRLFKELLTTFFIEFIQLFLPDVAAYIDPGSVEFLDKEIFTDVAAGDRHEVDLLAKARFCDLGEGYFLILAEPQAKSQSGFSQRLFQYVARILAKHNLPVYPVALFTFEDPKRPEPDHFQMAFPGFTVIDFHFRAIQLNRLNWRDYVRNPNPVASALMTRMRIEPPDRPRVKLECLRMLAKLRLDKARSTLISAFMENYLKLTAAETVVYNEELGSAAESEREVIMQLTNEWIERGREEGLSKGRLEGRLEGRRALVLRQLARLGQVSDEFGQRIGSLLEGQLDELAEALLGFRSIEDAHRWLNEHA
jgi:hypothetical protein